jgi:hypothetical protein
MGIFLNEFLLCCHLQLENVKRGNDIVSVSALFDLLLSRATEMSALSETKASY